MENLGLYILVVLGLFALSIFGLILKNLKKKIADGIIKAFTPESTQQLSGQLTTVITTVNQMSTRLNESHDYVKSIDSQMNIIERRGIETEKRCRAEFCEIHKEIDEVKSRINKIKPNGKKKTVASQYQFKGTCLVIDDNEQFADLTKQRMLECGYDVSVASSCKDTHALIKGRGPFDVWIIDQILPDGSGVELWKLVMKKFPTTKPIVISGFDIQGRMKDLKNLKHIQKDLENDAMFKKIEFYLDNWECV